MIEQCEKCELFNSLGCPYGYEIGSTQEDCDEFRPSEELENFKYLKGEYKMKKPIKTPPNCRYCGTQMYQDDVDYRFKGNADIYWGCPVCNASCIEELRFGQKFKERWRCDKNGVKNKVLKFKIDTKKI